MSSGIVSGGVIINGGGITGGGGGGGTMPSAYTYTPTMPATGTVQWNANSRELLVFNGLTWESIQTQPGHYKLMEKYPTLKQAWDHYQIVLRMCEAQERLEE